VNLLKHRLVRYLIVGGFAYLIEMATLFGLHHGLKISSVYSVAISFWVGLIVAFLAQKYITFENHEKRPHIIGLQLVIYGLLVGFNYLVTLLAVSHFSNRFKVYEIRTVVILLSTVWNYAVYRLLFKQDQLSLGE
jgi:putative flippase GtrA